MWIAIEDEKPPKDKPFLGLTKEFMCVAWWDTLFKQYYGGIPDSKGNCFCCGQEMPIEIIAWKHLEDNQLRIVR